MKIAITIKVGGDVLITMGMDEVEAFLKQHPCEAFTVREIAKHISIGEGSTRKACDGLLIRGLVNVVKKKCVVTGQPCRHWTIEEG